MKKSLILFLIGLVLLCSNTFAQGYYIYKDGFRKTIYANNVDSLVFFNSEEINGVEAIDLGLPSGVKWATRNIGASKQEESGTYFSWGEVQGKDTYPLSNYKFYKNDSYISLGNVVGTEYDAAHTTIGGGWRMPTMQEASELNDFCYWTDETLNGISGVRVTGLNGNSIFIPYSGYKTGVKINGLGSDLYLWTGQESTESESYYVYAKGENVRTDATFSKYYGLVVRPVITKPNTNYFSPITFAGSHVQDVEYYTCLLSCAYFLNADVNPTELGFEYKPLIDSSQTTCVTATVSGDLFICSLCGLCDGSEYEFVPYAIINDKKFYGEKKRFSTIYDPSKGNEYVDLGLPSGNLWARFDLGAESEKTLGLYFQWAGTQGEEGELDMSNPPYKGSEGNYYTKYWTKSNNSWEINDGKLLLEVDDDAAHIMWGGDWVIPTINDYKELVDKCTLIREGDSIKVVGPNGNFIYFSSLRTPTCLSTQYWTRNLVESSPTSAYVFEGYKPTSSQWPSGSRYLSCRIKAVIKK